MTEEKENNENNEDKLTYMSDRSFEALVISLNRTWAEVWIPGVCKHKKIRCLHGDDIIHHRGRRRICMICGRALKGPLPEICFFTGKPHHD